MNNITKIGLSSRTKADNEKYCTLLICTAAPAIGRLHLFAGLAWLGNSTKCNLQTGRCHDAEHMIGSDKEYQTIFLRHARFL